MTTFAPREYPVIEIAIANWSEAPEHIQEGDICGARRPNIGIGLAEAKMWLWLLVDGFESSELKGLTWPVYEPYDPTGEYDGPTYIKYDKRRFNIPFARLAELYPSIDLNRCRDINDAYQPFYTLDTDNNLWLTDTTPFQASGLIFDNVMGVYL